MGTEPGARWVAVATTGVGDPGAHDGTALLGPLPTYDVREPGFGEVGPQAFAVDLGAEAEPLPVHFHAVAQFQYFSVGSARFGPEQVGPGTVHFADAWTPYGPLRPGPEGVRFLTLRCRTDSGAHNMPGARQTLRDALAGSSDPPAGRRNESFAVGAGPPGRWTALTEHPDGLVVALGVGRGPGRLALPGGGYLLRLDQESLAAVALRWVPAGSEVALDADPGEPGSALLALGLPGP